MLKILESSRRLQVEPVGEPQSDEWDRFVRSRQDGTFCHLWGWRPIVEDLLGHECLYLTARTDDDEIAGVLPLARVRSRLFGDYLVSMPYLNYGGPLGDPDARELLAGQAREVAEGSGVDLLELTRRRCGPTSSPRSGARSGAP